MSSCEWRPGGTPTNGYSPIQRQVRPYEIFLLEVSQHFELVLGDEKESSRFVLNGHAAKETGTLYSTLESENDEHQAEDGRR